MFLVTFPGHFVLHSNLTFIHYSHRFLENETFQRTITSRKKDLDPLSDSSLCLLQKWESFSGGLKSHIFLFFFFFFFFFPWLLSAVPKKTSNERWFKNSQK